MSRSSFEFPPYVPVAERKKAAARLVKKLSKKGQKVNPIVIEGRAISKTFWGKSWCDNLNSYSDYENRMPRGRCYARNGSVIDLNIKAGEIIALVSGSEIYDVHIKISQVAKSTWQKIVKECSGEISSLIELLQGKFSKGVMEIITKPKTGLFPKKSEIKFDCSCFDHADMCKHVSAVLYGVGARLDENPEDLFLLRQANHAELIENVPVGDLSKSLEKNQSTEVVGDLSKIFGIDIVKS
jgi:uncharacterized Zn finger protein